MTCLHVRECHARISQMPSRGSQEEDPKKCIKVAPLGKGVIKLED